MDANTTMHPARGDTSAVVDAPPHDEAGGGSPTERMTAVVQDRYGPPGVLHLAQVATPSPRRDEVLVRVHAAALGPGDTFILRGEPRVMRPAFGLRRPRNRIRGFDLAGTVVAVGAGVTSLAPGDEVFGSTTTGSLAEYTSVPADRLALRPATLTVEQAAAVPESGLVALQGLRDAGRLRPGQRVLVNGAAGGIGTFAVQLARWMGAEVTGICSTRNVDLVAGLGADHVIDYTRENVVQSGRRWDLVFDNVGNHSASEWLRVLAPRGTLLPNSGLGGPWIGPLGRMTRALLRFAPTRRRLRMFVVTINRDDLEAMAFLLDDGTVRPVVDRVLPLAEAADAMTHVMGGHARGKVVVRT